MLAIHVLAVSLNIARRPTPFAGDNRTSMASWKARQVKAEWTVKTDVQLSYITSHRRGAAKITAQHHPQACAAAWRETRPITARIWPFLISRCVLVYPQKETLIRERSLRIPCSQLTAR
jgi:hypothetical protein